MYVFTSTVSLPNVANPVNAVIQVPVTFGNEVRYAGHNLLLSNQEIFTLCRDNDIALLVDSVEGLDNPFVRLDYTSKPSVDITSLLTMASKAGEDKLRAGGLDKIVSIFAKMNVRTTIEEVDPLIKNIFAFLEYLKGEKTFRVNVNISYVENKIRTKSLIDKINAGSGLPELYDTSFNRTSFQNQPHDKLFIKIPTYEDLLYMSPYALITPLKEVFNGYGDRTYLFSPNFREYKRSDDNINDVLGYPENNDLDIQDNEKDYYEELKKLVNWGLQQEYPKKSLEECLAENVQPKVVVEYLKVLAIEAIKYTRAHVGIFPIDFDIDNDGDNDDDVNDEGSEEVVYGKSFENEVTRFGGRFIDGETLVLNILENAAVNNVYVYCEAVIKFLRWGSRKPTQIKLNGMDKYLNLNDFTTTSTSDNLRSLRPKMYGDCNLIPVEPLVCRDVLKDKSNFIKGLGFDNTRFNSLIGIRGLRVLENDVQVFVFVDLFDIVKEYVKNDNKRFKLVGVYYENGKFVTRNPDHGINWRKHFDAGDETSLGTSLREIAGDEVGQCTVETSEDFGDCYLQYKCYNNKISSFSCLNEMFKADNLKLSKEFYAFSNKEELLESMKKTQAKANYHVTVNLGLTTLPAYLYVNETAQMLKRELDLTEWLNLAQDALNKFNLWNLCDVEKGNQQVVQPVNISPVGNALANALGQSTAFNVPTQEVKQAEVKLESPVVATSSKPDLSFLFTADLKGIPYRLVYTYVGAGNKIATQEVGWCIKEQTDKVPLYKMFKPEDKPVVSQGQEVKDLSFRGIELYVFDALYKVVIGNYSAINVRFKDADTIKYFRDIIRNAK